MVADAAGEHRGGRVLEGHLDTAGAGPDGDPVAGAHAGRVQAVHDRRVGLQLLADPVDHDDVAGLAGGSYAWTVSVFYPEAVFDVATSIFAIVFVLFGGAGTLAGPLLGVVLLYGLYNAIGITVPQYFQLIYGLLIMLLVLFLPNGLVSLFSRRGRRVP